MTLCIVPIFILCVFMFAKTWIFPSVLPNDYTLDFLRASNDIVSIISSTFIVGMLSSVITILVSISTARALALYNFRGKFIINLLVLLPLIVPSFTVVSVTHINMIRFHLSDTILGVSLIHSVFALPYGIKIIYDQTKALGTKYEEQAKNLGASNFMVLRTVYIPLIMPSIVLAFFLSFTISISQYVTTLIIGGGNVLTLSTVAIPYIQYGNYQLASIYSIMIIIISFLCYIIIDKVNQRILDWS